MYLMACAVVIHASLANPILLSGEELLPLTETLLLDVRPAERYGEGHIPGAISLPVSELSETRQGVTNLLRPVEELRSILAAHGVDPKNRVVVYGDHHDPVDITLPTRMFWILEHLGYPQVAFLNGGFCQWKEEERAVESAAVPLESIPVEKIPTPTAQHAIASREEVEKSLGADSAVLVDLRPKPYFTGESQRDYVKKKGHIPGALSLPVADFLSADCLAFAAKDSIQSLPTCKAIADTEKAVISYCNSGNSATAGYLALRLAGFKAVSVYDGSMAEWTSQSNAPVAIEK